MRWHSCGRCIARCVREFGVLSFSVGYARGGRATSARSWAWTCSGLKTLTAITYTILGVVDIASTLHLVRVMDDNTSEETACVYDEMWHGVFGDPTDAVKYDQAGSFKGKFDTLLEHINRRSKVSGLEAAWQNGTPEVHG